MLYYPCLSEFQQLQTSQWLTAENIEGGQVKIDKLELPDGEEFEDYNFWGYILQKEGKKYLLSSTDKNDKEINLKEFFPIKAMDLQKVSHKGIVYWLINKPVSMKYRPERTMSFRELINFMASFECTNRTHHLLNIFCGFSSYSSRFYDRKATPAGFGKDSIITIFAHLIGNCGSIVSPTLAKLEERANVLDWLVINEIVDIGKSDWDTIQQFLLDSGDHKPSITKHSRAFGNVGEIIDLSNLSINLYYNDIDHYPKTEKYFDLVSKVAVLDRFPAFRFWGKITEDFGQIYGMDIKQFVKKNYDDYIKVIRALVYYRDNLPDNPYDTILFNVPPRWKTNINILLRVIGAYAKDEEEYKKYAEELRKAINDYQIMLEYPERLRGLYVKMGIPKSHRERIKTLKECIGYLRTKSKTEQIEYCQKIDKANTFIEKIELIQNYKENNTGGIWNERD